jgi:hypothetical protein
MLSGGDITLRAAIARTRITIRRPASNCPSSAPTRSGCRHRSTAWPPRAAPGHCAARAPTPAARSHVAGCRRWGLARSAQFLVDRLRVLAKTMDAAGLLQQAYQLTFTAESLRTGGAGGAPAAHGAASWDAAARAWDRLHSPYPLVSAAGAALDGGDRDGATERLARAAALAEALTAGPLRTYRITGPASPPQHAGRPGRRPGWRRLRPDAREIEVRRWSPSAAPTVTSRPNCSSRPRPPASTSPTSWPSSTPPAVPKPPL